MATMLCLLLNRHADDVFNFFTGLGGFVGAAIGGVIYEASGPRVMFGSMGVIVFFTMILFYFSDRESVGRELKATCSRWRHNRGVRQHQRATYIHLMASDDLMEEEEAEFSFPAERMSDDAVPEDGGE